MSEELARARKLVVHSVYLQFFLALMTLLFAWAISDPDANLGAPHVLGYFMALLLVLLGINTLVCFKRYEQLK
ncbi:hypothetical protein ACFL5X_03225 [Candidatus Omnitrophota bacterium]